MHSKKLKEILERQPSFVVRYGTIIIVVSVCTALAAVYIHVSYIL